MNQIKTPNLKVRSYDFSLLIIKLVSNFPQNKVFWIFTNQLLRCGTSIGANIVEAKGASSRKEFIRYYGIALRSANETNYWLSLLRDSGLIESIEIEKLLKENAELSKMLGSSILSMKKKL